MKARAMSFVVGQQVVSACSFFPAFYEFFSRTHEQGEVHKEQFHAQ
jgi:hypothetical protein